MKRIVDYLQSKNSEDSVVKAIFDNILYYQAINTDQKSEEFTGTLYNYFVHECVKTNQYIWLSKKEFAEVHEAYKKLICNLRKTRPGEVTVEEIRRVVKEHRAGLIEIIINRVDDNEAILVPCSEYSVALQLKILRLNTVDISGPVIDIGCGKDARLVKFLSTHYDDVYGIDRYYNKWSRIICESWFDFPFHSQTWSTVISHMALSNHFRRAIAYKSKDVQKYAEKFREILMSLRLGGKLIYTPGIPEIENELNPKEYMIDRFKNADNNPILDTVHITRVG